MALILLTTVCLQLFLCALTNGLGAVSNCAEHGCPKYTVIKKTDEFEVRRYLAYKYVLAKEKGSSMFWANNHNFMKLFHYIGGKNQLTEKIPMTVPVICPLVHNGKGGFVKDFKMMFWLPEKYQCLNCAPDPIKEEKPEQQVQIVEWGERIAYVRSYGWWAIESLIKRNDQKLRASLDAAGIVAGVDYDDSVMYSSQYNSPMQIFNRHNEVMYMQKQK